MDYKTRHEEFVSGLTGSTINDVYSVSVVVMAAYLSWALLMNRLPQDHWITVRLIDFFLNWVVPLLAVTTYSKTPSHIIALVSFPPIFQRLVSSKRDTSKAAKKPQLHKPVKVESLGQIAYISAYRGAMLILTMIAILAVDFPIFPRKFAKVETWGTSLMDLGVGSFVFSNGLTSARPLLKKGIYGTNTAGFHQIIHLSGKILSMGIIRLVAVKLLNYQEHVTEYGVHWNFFITLGILPIVLPLFQKLGRYVPMIVLGIAVAIGYEIALKNAGLMEWVLTAERSNILAQNKEGLSSTVGFMAIFLIGQAVGYFVLPNVQLKSLFYPPQSPQDVVVENTKKQKKPNQNVTVRKLVTLIVFGIVFETLFRVFRTETHVSRRLANLPYILWVCSYNTFLIAVFAAISLVAKHSASASMAAVNNRGQTMFLVSNVCTGLVNMLVKTIDTSPWQGLGVLIAYLAVLYGISYALTTSSRAH